MIIISTIKRHIIAATDKQTANVIRKSTWALIAKVATVVFALGISLILGRIIGAEGLGIINLSIRVTNILILISILGVHHVVVKEVAVAHNKKNIEETNSLIVTALVGNGGIAFIVSMFFFALAQPICVYIFEMPDMITPFQMAMAVVVFQMGTRVLIMGLIGLNKIWQSNLFDQTLTYLFVFVALLIVWTTKIKADVFLVASIYAVSRLLVNAIAFGYWNTCQRIRLPRKLQISGLLRRSVPFFFISISTTIVNNIDIIILGILATSEEVGIYSVAGQIAQLPRMLLLVVNSALLPRIATLFNEKRKGDLEQLVRNTVKLLSLISGIVFIFIVLAGKYALKYWGAEFSAAFPILIVLGAGQFFNLATGPTGTILLMCNEEHIMKNIDLTTMIFCVVSSVLLTYIWGMMGIAIAQTATIGLKNVVQIIAVRRKLHIHMFPFASQ